LPVELDESFIDEVRLELPELPDAKRERFLTDYSLKPADVEMLISSREMAEYYEAVVSTLRGEAKLAANWVIGELAGALNRDALEIEAARVKPHALGELLARIVDGTISGKIAKDVFDAMWQGKGTADEIIDSRGLKQITDTGALEKIVDQVMADHPEQVQQFRDGKTKVIGFFVGKVMKATQGKANPAQVNELLRQKLA
jgi:aspartyl-tRNA(Asn)/glutamyl-tRNA(Gln) amidotransferase subunit B